LSLFLSTDFCGGGADEAGAVSAEVTGSSAFVSAELEVEEDVSAVLSCDLFAFDFAGLLAKPIVVSRTTSVSSAPTRKINRIILQNLRYQMSVDSTMWEKQFWMLGR